MTFQNFIFNNILKKLRKRKFICLLSFKWPDVSHLVLARDLNHIRPDIIVNTLIPDRDLILAQLSNFVHIRNTDVVLVPVQAKEDITSQYNVRNPMKLTSFAAMSSAGINAACSLEHNSIVIIFLIIKKNTN